MLTYSAILSYHVVCYIANLDLRRDNDQKKLRNSPILISGETFHNAFFWRYKYFRNSQLNWMNEYGRFGQEHTRRVNLSEA